MSTRFKVVNSFLWENKHYIMITFLFFLSGSAKIPWNVWKIPWNDFYLYDNLELCLKTSKNLTMMSGFYIFQFFRWVAINMCASRTINLEEGGNNCYLNIRCSTTSILTNCRFSDSYCYLYALAAQRPPKNIKKTCLSRKKLFFNLFCPVKICQAVLSS